MAALAVSSCGLRALSLSPELFSIFIPHSSADPSSSRSLGHRFLLCVALPRSCQSRWSCHPKRRPAVPGHFEDFLPIAKCEGQQARLSTPQPYPLRPTPTCPIARPFGTALGKRDLCSQHQTVLSQTPAPLLRCQTRLCCAMHPIVVDAVLSRNINLEGLCLMHRMLAFN